LRNVFIYNSLSSALQNQLFLSLGEPLGSITLRQSEKDLQKGENKRKSPACPFLSFFFFKFWSHSSEFAKDEDRAQPAHCPSGWNSLLLGITSNAPLVQRGCLSVS